MKCKKWQGLSCFLLASLMMSSTFAAPVRNESPTPGTSVVAPKKVETPKATTTPSTAPSKETAPKTTTMPKALEAPKATTMPKASETPKPATMPKASETPKATTMPKASETPKATTMPKASETPKATTMPKASKAPKKEESPCKKTCPNKPFALDHFKMIVNTLKKMGVEENEIVTYIKEGKKLEDILKAEKINPKKFKKCITKEYFKVVDEAQKNGQITCEQAKQLKAAIKETIKNWLPKK